MTYRHASLSNNMYFVAITLFGVDFFHLYFLVTRRLGGVGQKPCSPAAVLAFGRSFAQISEGSLTPLCRICLSDFSDFCAIVPGFVLIGDGIVTPLCRGCHFNLSAKLHGISSA